MTTLATHCTITPVKTCQIVRNLSPLKTLISNTFHIISKSHSFEGLNHCNIYFEMLHYNNVMRLYGQYLTILFHDTPITVKLENESSSREERTKEILLEVEVTCLSSQLEAMRGSGPNHAGITLKILWRHHEGLPFLPFLICSCFLKYATPCFFKGAIFSLWQAF